MNRLKSKVNGKIYYFRFWSEIFANEFWYTATTESIGFNPGHCDAFEPLDKSWEELKNEG